MRRTLVLAAALAFACAAAAQEGTLKKIKDSGSITIGHRESSIPFSYLDDKQQPVGYADLARLDPAMLLATFVIAVVASLLAGVLPAWRACQVAPAIQLKSQ